MRALAVVGALVVGGVAHAQPVTPAPAQPVDVPPPVPANAMTIEQAVQLALTRNERAQVADLDVVVADAAVSRARSQFLPSVQANGNDTERWHGDPHNVAQATLQVSQPLFVPSAFPLLSQAKHNRRSAEAQSADDKRQLAFDAAKTFMNVLLQEQVVVAAEKKLETSKEDLQDTQRQAAAQLVSSNDVTRAQISLAGSQRELAANQGNRDAAYVQLAYLVSSQVPAVAPPADLLSVSAAAQPTPDELVSQSIGRRPDLVARKESALAAHDFAREPRYRYLPSFGLGGSLTATTNDQSGHHLDGQVAVTASWNLFDAGVREADARSRDAQAKIADLQAQALVREIDADVRSAAAQLAASQLALQSARDARDASRKSAFEAGILYHQGLAKAIELIDANDQRFIAEVNYASSEFNVAVAYLDLRQAMGLSPLEGAK